MTTPARALSAPGPRPLPDRAARLLEDLDAPPRLGAHLRAVHDVACRLVEWLAEAYPDAEVDGEAVLFGAATHDIGKVRPRWPTWRDGRQDSV